MTTIKKYFNSVTNSYQPIKVTKQELTDKHFLKRNFGTLTGSEVEEIFRKENKTTENKTLNISNMKAICTSYNKTDKGLVLRNNWVDEVGMVEYELKEYLSNYFENTEELIYVVKSSLLKVEGKGYSEVIEGKMSLDNVVIHIRIVK